MAPWNGPAAAPTPERLVHDNDDMGACSSSAMSSVMARAAPFLLLIRSASHRLPNERRAA